MEASAKVVTFRLLDKKVDPNSVFFNEDGTKDEAKKQDFNNRYGVLNPYYILHEDGKREVRQYIAGCSFFDPVKQKLEGYIPTVDNSIVEFKAGGDIILDENDDAVLISWAKDHPHNSKSKYHKKDKHDALFFLYDPKEEQKVRKDKASDEDQAMMIILGLQKDPARLKAIGNLFEETSGILDETDIYLGLREIAKENPGVFINSIADREKSVAGDIRLALKYTIINRNAKGFYFEGTDAIILKTTEKSESTAIMELGKFLMSRDGKEFYKQILIKIDQKEIEIMAPEGTTKEPEKEEELA